MYDASILKNSEKISEMHNETASSEFLCSMNGRSFILIWAIYVIYVMSTGKFNLACVTAYAAFPLFIAIYFDLSFGTILKRLILFFPFIILIALANPIFDRHPLMIIENFTLTSGMMSGAVILAKSLLLIASAVIFSMILPFHRICDALRSFHFPDIFITQLVLLHRYSFLLVEEAVSIQKARDMRSFGKRGREFFTTAGMLGSLLLRTTNRAERIYRGMFARGFTGSLQQSCDADFTAKDLTAIICATALFLIVRAIFW